MMQFAPCPELRDRLQEKRKTLLRDGRQTARRMTKTAVDKPDRKAQWATGIGRENIRRVIRGAAQQRQILHDGSRRRRNRRQVAEA
jgi:hypothetical protein